jgi:hypothetical protein
MEKAYKALDELRLLVGGVELDSKSKVNEKIGLIYSLSSKGGKVYVGFEYEKNVEKMLKDLLVRYVGYMEMGYLHESSAGVLNDAPVSYKLLKRVEVKSKYELGRLAEEYMLEMSEVVNLWRPEELLRGNVIGLYEKDERIEEVDKYKTEKWEELVEKYGSEKKAIEYRKMRMYELRELKEELYDMMINNKPKMKEINKD